MEYYFCIDVGGTNMTVGLFSVTVENLFPKFTLLEHKSYQSREIPHIIHGLDDAIPYFKHKYSLIDVPPINISACGPTDGLTCQPTNLPAPEWCIERKKIENRYQTQVFLINDFAGVVYGLMTLEKDDEKIVHIPLSPTAYFSYKQESIKVGLGAGTGLGCATIHHKGDQSTLISSEAGWLDFAPNPHNVYEVAFMYFLAAKSPDGKTSKNFRKATTSWEDAISASRGITFIYDFFCNKDYSQDIITDQERAHLDEINTAHERNAIPQKISALAKNNILPAKKIISFWVTLYARYAQQIALTKLPYGGMFLGGGAGAKNIEFFLDNNLFYNTFITHSNKDIKNLLENIPLYMITDYYISLYGNAYHLFKSRNL